MHDYDKTTAKSLVLVTVSNIPTICCIFRKVLIYHGYYVFMFQLYYNRY